MNETVWIVVWIVMLFCVLAVIIGIWMYCSIARRRVERKQAFESMVAARNTAAQGVITTPSSQEVRATWRQLCSGLPTEESLTHALQQRSDCMDRSFTTISTLCAEYQAVVDARTSTRGNSNARIAHYNQMRTQYDVIARGLEEELTTISTALEETRQLITELDPDWQRCQIMDYEEQIFLLSRELDRFAEVFSVQEYRDELKSLLLASVILRRQVDSGDVVAARGEIQHFETRMKSWWALMDTLQKACDRRLDVERKLHNTVRNMLEKSKSHLEGAELVYVEAEFAKLGAAIHPFVVDRLPASMSHLDQFRLVDQFISHVEQYVKAVVAWDEQRMYRSVSAAARQLKQQWRGVDGGLCTEPDTRIPLPIFNPLELRVSP